MTGRCLPLLAGLVNAALLAVVVSCGPTGDGNAKPAGTPTDPVDTCEKPDQVCRFRGSQLGVCNVASGSGETAKLVCSPQH